MQQNKNQCIKFLVASDNHLGANEYVGLKSNRYQDAFEAFEEVLQIAQAQNVDFLILGGDLFHEKHPTEHCLLKCIDILQRYVFGDNFGGIQMELNSLNYQPNFGCSNFNIQLPIFIINGNHDDIITEREESVSILDILHESKYLNYIGKITDQSYVSIKPVVLMKHNLKIALYGLGYMKDYQLCKLIQEGKLRLELLDENNFNILIVHQNRNKGTHFSDEKNFVDPLHFKKFNIDLIVWGHEHEAYLLMQFSKYNLEKCEHFQIFFAGSTVATSLIEYEALIKQAGLFTLSKNEMKFESIKLEKSYRPIIYKAVELSELVKGSESQTNFTAQELAEKLLYETVEKELVTYFQTSKYRQKKPLMRFKVEYTGFELMKMRFLETKFADRVSNPDKIFLFWEKRSNLQKQIEKRKDQADILNQQFNEIFKNKVDVTSQNQSLMSEFSVMLQTKLNSLQFSLIEQGDFLSIFDSFLNSSNKEKNNLFNDLTSKSIERFKKNTVPQYQKRMNQVLQKQREHQEYLTFCIRDSLLKDFSNTQPKVDQQFPDTSDYLSEINSVFVKFQEEFRLETTKITQGSKLNVSIQPRQIQQEKPPSVQQKIQSQVILIEDDSQPAVKGQTQTSLFEEDEEIEERKDNVQSKKGAKKRKPMKKEEEVIMEKPQKQQIKIPPFKSKGNNFF